MNKLLFPLALLITLSACSQGSAQRSSRDENPSGSERSSRNESPALDRFYDRFNADNKEGQLSFDPGFLLNANFSGKGKGSSSDGWMHKITRIRLLILDDKASPARQQEWSELSRSLKEDRFDELVSIRKGADRVQLLSKERKDGDKEVVFLAGGKDGGGLFIHFRGPFTEQDMEKIQSSFRDHDSRGHDNHDQDSREQ